MSSEWFHSEYKTEISAFANKKAFLFVRLMVIFTTSSHSNIGDWQAH